MTCEHLICAQCGGPVAEGRCPTCRQARAHVHQHGHAMSAPLIAAVLLILALLAVAALHLGR
jgi:hypothetical protein